MSKSLFVEPQDVLYLRGNKLFDGPGSYSELQMPPWPSMIAGALRSSMLAEAGVDMTLLRDQRPYQPAELFDCLGLPNQPGAFRVRFFSLARQLNAGKIEVFFPLPADVVVRDTKGAALSAQYLQPHKLDPVLASSSDLPEIPILAAADQGKPAQGYWLNSAGLEAYVRGSSLIPEHLVHRSKLWLVDSRLGIGMDHQRRSAAEGQIYTSDTAALAEKVGFVVAIEGADEQLPEDALLRLGGDGRAARATACSVELPEFDINTISTSRRFRLVMATPGLFEDGWKLPGMAEDGDAIVWQADGFTARLRAASIPRANWVSGWDLATRSPKPAVKTVPVGSVYWFDHFEGDAGKLVALMESGLLDNSGKPETAARGAEGFNNILIAAWPETPGDSAQE